jgi:hypothetical protein
MKINASSLNLKYILIFHEIMTGNKKGAFFMYNPDALCHVHTRHLVVIVYISQSACGLHHVEQHAVNQFLWSGGTIPTDLQNITVHKTQIM